MASCSTGMRSNQLSYYRNETGAEPQSRTAMAAPGLQVQLLWILTGTGRTISAKKLEQGTRLELATFCMASRCSSQLSYPCKGETGAENETRTRDLDVGNVTLYQTELFPRGKRGAWRWARTNDLSLIKRLLYR